MASSLPPQHFRACGAGIFGTMSRRWRLQRRTWGRLRCSWGQQQVQLPAQCLQTFASLRMVSAQKGHFRTLLTLGAGAPIKPTIRSPIGPSNNPPRNHAPALLPFDEAIAAAPMPQTIHMMMYSMFYIPPTLPTPQGSGKVNTGSGRQ